LDDLRLRSARHPVRRTRHGVDRLEEAIAVIKDCFSDGLVDFKASTTRSRVTTRHLHRSSNAPADPDRWWGPRMLRLAGREADIVGINPNMRAGAFGPTRRKTPSTT